MYVENRQFSHPRVFNAPADGVPLGIWHRRKGSECFYDGAIRRSKKFSDRFSRFDTIPAVTDTQPASHVAVAIMLNALAKASSLIKVHYAINAIIKKYRRIISRENFVVHETCLWSYQQEH